MHVFVITLNLEAGGVPAELIGHCVCLLFFGLNYYIYEGCYAWMSYAILYYMIFRWIGRYLKGMLLLVEMSLIYRQWSLLFGRLTFV